MSRQSGRSVDDYSWGEPCADGASLGLFVTGRTFARDASIPWRWALRNLTDSPLEVTIRHRDDPLFRTRLAVRRADSSDILWEFTPPSPLTTRNVVERTTLLKEPVILDGGDASIDRTWGPGDYDLQVTFGGGPFRFECRSGVVRIRVR